MSSGAGDTTQLVPGYPIRTPWDHSSVDSSPRPIAASHVLHRLLVPRHPPFALDNLTTKMLASTVQFSTNDQPTTHQQHQTRNPNPNGPRSRGMSPRPCLDTIPPRPPPPGANRSSTARKNNPPPPPAAQPQDRGAHPTTCVFVSSGPNRVPTANHQPHHTPVPPPPKGRTPPHQR